MPFWNEDHPWTAGSCKRLLECYKLGLFHRRNTCHCWNIKDDKTLLPSLRLQVNQKIFLSQICLNFQSFVELLWSLNQFIFLEA